MKIGYDTVRVLVEGAPGQIYSIQGSDDLIDWSTVTQFEPEQATEDIPLPVIPTAIRPQFFRLQPGE